MINGLADYAIMEVGLVCRCAGSWCASQGLQSRRSNVRGEVRGRVSDIESLAPARLGELVKKEV